MNTTELCSTLNLYLAIYLDSLSKELRDPSSSDPHGQFCRLLSFRRSSAISTNG